MSADDIRKLGFRRWYERQLLESHACLVTCFLCTILLAVCLEGAMPRSGLGNSLAALFCQRRSKSDPLCV
jgi:hypothetical protein